MTFDFDIRVYFEDTDSGGIVYYANYLKFLERARTEMMRGLGYESSKSWDDLGWIFVVAGVNIQYKRPAKLDDLLTVKSHISDIQPKRLSFTQNVYRQSKIITESVVELACMNKQGRAIQIDSKITDIISPYLDEKLNLDSIEE